MYKRVDFSDIINMEKRKNNKRIFHIVTSKETKLRLHRAYLKSGFRTLEFITLVNCKV